MNAYEKIRACIYHPNIAKEDQAIAALAELEKAAAEPLFILTTGAIGSDGEQDDWDIECDSSRRLESFCAAHPGDTVKLYAAPPAPVAEIRDAERYRWLRRKVYVVGLHHLSDNDCGQFEFANLPRISEPMAGVGSAAEALDAVIDAALSEIKL